MAGSFEYKVDASALMRLRLDMADAGKKTPAALRLSINYAGDRGYTAVKRHLAQQVGLQQRELGRSAGLKKIPATVNGRKTEYVIVARSRWTPLSYYAPRQTKSGVSAAPWKNRQIFSGSFIATMNSGHVGVFVRTGDMKQVAHTGKNGRVTYRMRQSIRELWGPSLAIELMRKPTPQLFAQTALAAIGPRLQHEVSRLTKRVA